MTNLVRSLREADVSMKTFSGEVVLVNHAAADRIEQLEAALRELSTDWDCCAVSKNMKLIARKAREGTHD